MFRWYTNEFKYNLRNKLDNTEIIDIVTCEDIISSHVRISYRFYQFVTTRYTTDFYIIKSNPSPSPNTTRTCTGQCLRACQSVSKCRLKCRNKFDCLVYEILVIRALKPNLNVQSDSIRAKVFLLSSRPLMFILRAKIVLNAVICIILFKFSLIMESWLLTETSDFIVRFYRFILKWLDCKIK